MFVLVLLRNHHWRVRVGTNAGVQRLALELATVQGTVRPQVYTRRAECSTAALQAEVATINRVIKL